MMEFLGSDQDLAVRIVYALILIWAWLIYLDLKPWNKADFVGLIRGTIAFKIAFVLAQTIAQYSVWSGNEFTRIFLTSPNTGILNFKGGYFIFYIWNRFWLSAVLGILIAWIFYKFLVFLRKYRERFLGEGEAELGLLTALLSGWPGFVVFVPLVFVSVALISVMRNAFMKEKYTTLGPSFLLAAAAILAFGPYFSGTFGLQLLTF